MGEEKRVSIPVGDKVLLPVSPFSNGSVLHVYEETVKTWSVHRSFLEDGLSNGRLGFFAWDKTSQKLYPERGFGDAVESGRLRLHPLERRGIGGFSDLDSAMEDFLSKASEKDNRPRIVLDFGTLPTPSNFETMYSTVKKIARETEQSGSSQLKSIISVASGSLKKEDLTSLTGLFESFLIQSESEPNFLSFNLSGVAVGTGSKKPVEISSADALEEFVKGHLETIVLSLLRKDSMCGYDIIKSIHRRYHTLLSQGTVYPLLYNMKDEGTIKEAEAVDSRSKVYELTEEGREVAERQINEFLEAQRYMMETMGESGRK